MKGKRISNYSQMKGAVMNYKEEALKMIEEGRVVFPLRDIDGNITGVIGKLLFKKDLILSVRTRTILQMMFLKNLQNAIKRLFYS